MAQNQNNLERLVRAFAELVPPDSSLLPGEPAMAFYSRLEPFRRICEARQILRWIAEDYFNSSRHLFEDDGEVRCRRSGHSALCYLSSVGHERSDESAKILAQDVLNAYSDVIQRDPLLKNVLEPQIKLIKESGRFVTTSCKAN